MSARCRGRDCSPRVRQVVHRRRTRWCISHREVGTWAGRGVDRPHLLPAVAPRAYCPRRRAGHRLMPDRAHVVLPVLISDRRHTLIPTTTGRSFCTSTRRRGEPVRALGCHARSGRFEYADITSNSYYDWFLARHIIYGRWGRRLALLDASSGAHIHGRPGRGNCTKVPVAASVGGKDVSFLRWPTTRLSDVSATVRRR